MSRNLYREFVALLPQAVTLCGSVTTVRHGIAEITLPGGSLAWARGEAQIGDRVFVTDGKIDGPAPDLPLIELEV